MDADEAERLADALDRRLGMGGWAPHGCGWCAHGGGCAAMERGWPDGGYCPWYEAKGSDDGDDD